MPIKMRVYARGPELLVAACDAELIGRTLKEGEVRLQVGDFYDGDVVTEEDLVEQVRNSTMGNFVGEETITACMKHELIDKDGVIRIQGVPHAQRYTM